MFDVITIGAGTRDVFLVSDQFQFISSPQFETGIGECVALGTKIELDHIVHTTGGGATNAAVTFARLGLKTAAMCRVGDDSAGRDLIIDLHRDGVDTTLIRRVPRGATGYSTLLTATGGERTVLVYRGVSATFTPKDLSLNDCHAHWFYLTSLGGNLALSKKIIQHAVKCRTSVAWNPGKKEIQKGFAAWKSFFPHVTIVNMNREEAESLTGKKTLPEIFTTLHRKNGVTLITDGDKGAYAAFGSEMLFVGTRGIKATSRTGAGDAFGSGFLAGYVKTKDVKQSLAIATLNAESVIQQVGAKAGILKSWPKKSLINNIPIRAL